MVQRDMTAKWQSQGPQVQIAFWIWNDFSHRRIILLSSYRGTMALNLSFSLQVQWCLIHSAVLYTSIYKHTSHRNHCAFYSWKALFYLEFQFGNSISRSLQYIRAVLLSLKVCPGEGMHLQNMAVGIPMTWSY